MLYKLSKQPLRIKSALVAIFFVAAQISSLGLAGGKAFAAEGLEHANEHATDSIVEHQPEAPGDQNNNANEENGPTSPVAVDATEQAGNNQNTPENGPPEEVVEHLTELSETKNENVGNGVLNNPSLQQKVEDEPEVVVMVTLCHATGSESHSFEKITVAAAGAYNGHLGTGNGDHQNGEDIIPPFEFQGQSYSQNWDAAGQATFNNGCVVPEDEEQPPEETKVTLCHATGSTSNPFVVITVAAAGAFNGHLGSSHQNGEDVIPPFTFNGQSYSQNWDAAGQATFNNGCVVPTGGQGGNGDTGGQVLGASTTAASGGQGAGEQLVNTGSNLLMSIIVSLTMIGLTAGAHLLTRKQYV